MKKLKNIVILFTIFLSTHLYAQEKGVDLNWQTDFEKVKKQAQNDDKLILIYFTGSDWNKACQRLNKEFFYTKKFKDLASENLILLRINKPRRSNLISEYQKSSNEELSKKYDQKVFPTVILVDADGKEIGRVESYNYLKDTSSHYALVEKAIKKRP